MIGTDGRFVERFEDCPVFNKKYPGLDKTKINVYRDTPAELIKQLNKESDDGREIRLNDSDDS